VTVDRIATVRASFDAIGRVDLDALLALYHDDVEFLPVTGTKVERGGYRGHAGVREYFEEVAPVWEEMQPYGGDFREVGDSVVVIGGCRVRGRGSGAETDSPMAWVITFRGDKIASHRGFADADKALEAAGVSA
jgi:ketosteroid isomerase-like protein